MPGKNNKEQLEEVPEEQMPEEMDNFNPEELVEPSPEDILKEDIEKLKSIKAKIIDAITTNQKYIKRNFDEINELKDNLKILLEKTK